MAKYRLLALLGIGLIGSAALATEVVGVNGSNTRYTTPLETQVGDKQVNLVLTGTALRKKLIVNVYTIGSYLQQGVSVKTAEELAAVDCAKRLHLVMERDVAGKDMAEAFRAAIRVNYPSPQFTDEVNAMVGHLQANEARKGEQVWLTHVPKSGLHIQVAGKAKILIANPAFSRAVWDIYLGKNNLGEALKRSLVARL